MTGTNGGNLRDVPFRIENPERIPAKRYFDEGFYQAEVEHVWPRTWQMACRLEQIPEVGDWVEYQNLGKSVIIVRADKGVKAFHNACRHRGVPFAGGHGNDHGNCSRSGFMCPFHGWRWNMHGENTFVYGKQLFSEEQLDADDINLVPCRVETAIGCAFINYDNDAPSLRDSIGPLIDRLEARNVGQLRSEWWYGTHLPANWKIAMEAFMEGYHVAATHPQLQEAAPMIFEGRYTRAEEGRNYDLPIDRSIPVRDNIQAHFRQLELTGEGMAGMVHAKEVAIARELLEIDLPEDHDQAFFAWFGRVQSEVTAQLRARGEPVPDLNEVAMSAPLEAVEFLFPHYFLLPMLTSYSSYRIRPTGPESCFFEIWSLTFFPEGEEPEAPMQPTILPYDSMEFPPIPRQDYSNIPIQQIGVHAPGFEFMRLSKHVEGMVSNYQQIIDGYIAGVPSEKLIKATHCLAGNFDGKIETFDF
ncbi:MAG: SRPBCC family protein [Novosphingobium sp.]